MRGLLLTVKPAIKKLTKSAATYRPAIVTFIDVLGFRELVRKSSAEEIRKIVQLTQRKASSDPDELTALERKEDVNWTRTVAFSDSIIRVRPYDAEYSEGPLFYEVIDLVHAQADLANQGIFIRGGMTVGDVYFENQSVYGPAFVRAYDLESQYANVPRIVIGPEVFREFRKNPKLRKEGHDLADEVHYLRKLLRRGEDGFWFVDYLTAIAGEMDNPDVDYPKFLERCRKFIIDAANATPTESKALQKYLWLAEYHNSVCDRSPILSDLLITKKDIASIETLPEVSKSIRD